MWVGTGLWELCLIGTEGPAELSGRGAPSQGGDFSKTSLVGFGGNN